MKVKEIEYATFERILDKGDAVFFETSTDHPIQEC